MTKLLSAEFSRLWKTRMFWLEMALALAFSLYICFVNYDPALQNISPLALEDVFFTFHQFSGVFFAASISLILGTEYSDGTLRNKLIVGHRRSQIYLAELIVATVTSLLVVVIHAAVTLCLGYSLFGGFQISVSQVIYAIVCIALVSAVFSAICTAITMNCQNKAITAVICLVVVLVLLFLGGTIGNKLLEEEMIYDNITITMDGVQFGDLIPNPSYVSGKARTALEWVYDLLPSGQINQMYCLDFARSQRWPLLSLLLFAAASAAGMLLFRRKDLK